MLKQAEEENKLLLIEEPEAHLHPQRQLQVMQYLRARAEVDNIQILITTHSPNLASVIPLDNLVMVHARQAFPLGTRHTLLAPSDYSFLERFLDVTKANLFFAKSVLIVEGDAENILIPSLAEALGKSFTRNGVSIVNVGSVGLGRYARIFLRSDTTRPLRIPVACITDMDIMPDCAPEIIGKVKVDDDIPAKEDRKWRIESDFNTPPVALQEERTKKVNRANGQYVKTFVSDEWTFEYDLAYSGLAEDMYLCACLTEKDEKAHRSDETRNEIIECSIEEYSRIKGLPKKELYSRIYAKFSKGQASKAMAAQYLAQRIKDEIENQALLSIA